MHPATLWIVLPVVGAGIGWFTNHLAVMLLFRPRRPIGVGPLRLHGLIPRRHTEVAERVAEITARDLVRPEDLHAAIENVDWEGVLRRGADRRVADFLDEMVHRINPMLSAFISDEFLDRLRTRIVDEIVTLAPTLVEEAGDRILADFDVRTLVHDKIAAFDTARLEEIVREVAHRELRSIEVLGGVLGALVGLAEAALMTFMGAV